MIQVLIVDDEHFVRRALIQTTPWEKHGIQVAGEAENGQQALEIVQSQKVDLLFVDLSMPGMSGLELIRKLNEEFPDKSSVILTCHQDFKYAQEAIRLGALDYIVKTQMTRDNMDSILESIVIRYKQQQEVSQAKRNVFAHSDEIRKLWAEGDWIFIESEEAFGFVDSAVVQAWLAPYSTLQDIFTFSTSKEKSWSEWAAVMRKKLRTAAKTNSISEEVCKSAWKALLHMILNYGESINQSELSHVVGMNRSYFSKVFSALFERPFNLVLRDIRMNSAEHLLIHRQQPIYWIAKEVGYQDDKYFSRIFKEQTGYLPSEYRELKRDSTL